MTAFRDIRLTAALWVSLIWAAESGAQIVIEEVVTTDTVNVFAPSARPGKSPALAMAATVLLPGLGHQYLGKPHRALTYFSFEALCLAGIIYGRTYAARTSGDARAQAWHLAGVKAGSGADDAFWQNVGRYMDVTEYNRIMELNRTPDEKYDTRVLSWRWENEESMDYYRQLREDITRWELIGAAFAAGMVLNRVVAFVDVRLASKYRGVRGQARLEIQPQFAPAVGAAGLCLRAGF